MEKKKIKLRIAEFIFIIGIVVFSSLISAMGVSILYSPQAPLIIAPGETKDFQINLMTTQSEGNLTVRASLLNGSEVVKIMDSSLDYPVLIGKNGIVNVRVSIPRGTPENTQYFVKFSFIDVTPSENGGTVSFRQAMEPSFNLLVQTPPAPVSTPEPSPTPAPQNQGVNVWWILLLIVLIIAIIIIVYLITKSRKK